MSWVGHGQRDGPCAGDLMLLADSMSTRASACALGAQRHVHGHLVAVEVCVEGGAHERVQLDGLALDEHRLEGLDAQTVQRGGHGSAAQGAR